MNTVSEREELDAITDGRWFSSLSPSLRQAILGYSAIRRFGDAELIASRGDSSDFWMGCAAGAVRVSSTSTDGKPLTLTYVEPGVWFGDVGIFDGGCRTHDAHACGATTLYCVSLADFRRLLADHTELYQALMRLQARRLRALFGLVEDLNTLPLRARVAKQLAHLARHHGIALDVHPGSLRIGLNLAQEELAQLLGASRQRVNGVLKEMERNGVLRVSTKEVVVLDNTALERVGQGVG